MAGLRLRRIHLSDLSDLDNLLQSGFWGAFKRTGGWTPRAFRWERDGSGGPLLVLERKVARTLPLAYVPYGPDLPDGTDAEERTDLLDELARELQGELSLGCFFVRFDLLGGTGGPVGSPEADSFPYPLSRPLRRSPYRVQPPDTVVLGLESDEVGLLAGMHKKTRYNVRLAEKKGVEVTRYAGEEAVGALASWYALYRETARRDGIALHGEDYYRRLFRPMPGYGGPVPSLSLWMAAHGGENLAGIITAVHGKRATYLYGASSSHGRELMPNYLLQWRAILDARDAGAREYDFFGIPPNGDPSHPMAGLWRFKTGFGGRVVHNLGAWDRPFSRSFYPLYAAAEKIRGLAAAARKRRRS